MTLLKAYLIGSNNPFVLAKAFLEETLADVSDVIVKENKFNTQEWMDIFVESSKTIKDKSGMKAALRRLLAEKDINEALNEQVTYGKGLSGSGKGAFRSGMANYDTKTERTGKDSQKTTYQFTGAKLAQPETRIQNLNRLGELLSPFENEYPEIQRIKDAIESQIEHEKTREDSSQKKSPQETTLRRILTLLSNPNKSPLRRYRSGKYPHKFIQVINQLKDLNVTLKILEELSQGYTEKHNMLRDSRHWFMQKLSTDFSGKTLLEHFEAAWVEDEEDQIEDEDLKLFRDAMYDLIEDAGWELESQKSKKYVSVLTQAKNLLTSLENDFKTFTRLQEKGIDNNEVIESMMISFTALQNKFNSLKDKKNKKGNPVIPEDIRADLENSIKTFNEAFEGYDIEIKVKTPMDKVSWVKRIAEDAQDFAKNNKSLLDTMVDSGIAIEGLEHLTENAEGMGREQLRDYVDARLPTIDRNNYMIIEGNKLKGFDEDKYKDALEARDETIDKIIRERPINRQDLLWLLPKRKMSKDKGEVTEYDDDKYQDDDAGGGIAAARNFEGYR